MTREERLSSAPLNHLMLTMAVPTMVAQIINILYNLVDRIYIGHIPGAGSAALTGVGVTLPIVVLISAFSAFVGNGGAPLSAIWLGKGDKDHAERILGNGVSLLVFFTVVLMGVFYAFQKPLLYLFGASDATVSYGMEYLSWYLVGTLAVELALGLNPYIIFQGHAKTGMASVLIGAVLNLLLDPLFIFVFQLGVMGAAIATVISQFVSALWVVGFLVSKRASVRLRPSCLRPEKKILSSICSLGISPFVMRSTECLISVVMTHGLQTYGGDLYVGSLTVMQSVMQFFSAPISGFTSGVQPIISYNFGARNFDRVRATYRRMIALCGGFSCLTTIIAMLWPEQFASLFTQDPQLVALVGEKMPLFLCGMLVFGLQMAIQPTFLALGQAKVSLFIAMLRKVILLVPLALILPRFLGVDGVYWAEPISDFLSAGTATVLFLILIRHILSDEMVERVG
jgi:putative MATE family efflux protein